MIIRNSVARHGRKVVASQSTQTCLRTLSTRPTATAPITSADIENAERLAALEASLAWAKQKADAEARKKELAAIPENFRTFKRIQRHTASLGSAQVRRHDSDPFKNPPDDVTLEMLLAAQTHMGHNKSLWNPANARYIYGVREGIHIIGLETTAAHLRRAARVVEEVAYGGGVILFVGTRKGQKNIVVKAAELAGACHLFTKWIPGAITNRDQILQGLGIQMVDVVDKKVDGFEELTDGMRPLVPDLVVCLNPVENWALLHECGFANVPTIGVVDTDADPSWVTYQIPANDDSLRSVGLIAAMLGRAGQRGQQRRLEAARAGHRTWEIQEPVRKYVQLVKQRSEEEKRVADGVVVEDAREKFSLSDIRSTFGSTDHL